jgi:hypothetical protein
MTATWTPPRVKTSERPNETPSAKNSTVPVAGQGAELATVAVNTGGRVVIERSPDDATVVVVGAGVTVWETAVDAGGNTPLPA